MMLALFAYGFFSGTGCCGCGSFTMLFSTLRYPSVEIAAIISLYGAVLTGSKILFGKLDDLFGTRHIGPGAFVLETIGTGMLCFSANHLFGYAGVVLMAVAYFARFIPRTAEPYPCLPYFIP